MSWEDILKEEPTELSKLIDSVKKTERLRGNKLDKESLLLLTQNLKKKTLTHSNKLMMNIISVEIQEVD